MDELIDPDGVELANLEAATAYAIRSAYGIMAADIAEGKLNLNLAIVVEDDAGNVLRTVYFRDLVKIEGLPN